MREARERNGWSREVVAARAGLSMTLIRSLELGRRATLTLDEAMALSRALGTTVIQLLGEEI
jgi:transcriptional regulator with XRE-family HTH domain